MQLAVAICELKRSKVWSKRNFFSFFRLLFVFRWAQWRMEATNTINGWRKARTNWWKNIFRWRTMWIVYAPVWTWNACRISRTRASTCRRFFPFGKCKVDNPYQSAQRCEQLTTLVNLHSVVNNWQPWSICTALWTIDNPGQSAQR